MTIRVGIIMDPIAQISFKKDSSLAMLLAAQARGWSLHYMEQRSRRSNRQLGLYLAFVAGAANAGGFMAVQQYTSHMTGIVSTMADALALGRYQLVLAGLGALLSFVLGAMCSTLMINFARRRRLHSVYAAPLAVEAWLLR